MTKAADTPEAAVDSVDLRHEFEAVDIAPVLEQLDRELIGLAPVKNRIRQIASLLLVERIRQKMGLATTFPTLHMSFSGNAGTGKTTVAMRMAGILHRLGFVRRGHVISVTRDDLVGQYIGHTAPKTKEVLKKAMGGVLFIDEAYYLYRPENERDYGQEAIEILLQIMESQRSHAEISAAADGQRHRPPSPHQDRVLRGPACHTGLSAPARCAGADFSGDVAWPAIGDRNHDVAGKCSCAVDGSLGQRLVRNLRGCRRRR
jgi:hypothetical protein